MKRKTVAYCVLCGDDCTKETLLMVPAPNRIKDSSRRGIREEMDCYEMTYCIVCARTISECLLEKLMGKKWVI